MVFVLRHIKIVRTVGVGTGWWLRTGPAHDHLDTFLIDVTVRIDIFGGDYPHSSEALDPVHAGDAKIGRGVGGGFRRGRARQVFKRKITVVSPQIVHLRFGQVRCLGARLGIGAAEQGRAVELGQREQTHRDDKEGDQGLEE